MAERSRALAYKRVEQAHVIPRAAFFRRARFLTWAILALSALVVAGLALPSPASAKSAAAPTAAMRPATGGGQDVTVTGERVSYSYGLRVAWAAVGGATSYEVSCTEAVAAPAWVSLYFETRMAMHDGYALFGFRQQFAATATGTEVLFADRNVVSDATSQGTGQVVTLEGMAMPGATYSCTVTPMDGGTPLSAVTGQGVVSTDLIADESSASGTPAAHDPVYIVDCVQTTYNGLAISAVVLSQQNPGTNEALSCRSVTVMQAMAAFQAQGPLNAKTAVKCVANGVDAILEQTNFGDPYTILGGARGGKNYTCSVAPLSGSVTTRQINTGTVSSGVPNLEMQSSMTVSPGRLMFSVSGATAVNPPIMGDYVAHCTGTVNGVERDIWRRAIGMEGAPTFELSGIPGGTWSCSAWMANDVGQGSPTTSSELVPDPYAPPTDVVFRGELQGQNGGTALSQYAIQFRPDATWAALAEGDRAVHVNCYGEQTGGGAASSADTAGAIVGFGGELLVDGTLDEGQFLAIVGLQYNATYSCVLAPAGTVQAAVEGFNEGTYLRFSTAATLPLPGTPTLETLSSGGGSATFRVTPAESPEAVLEVGINCGDTQGWQTNVLQALGEDPTSYVWEGTVSFNNSGQYTCVARTRTAAGYSPLSSSVMVGDPPSEPSPTTTTTSPGGGGGGGGGGGSNGNGDNSFSVANTPPRIWMVQQPTALADQAPAESLVPMDTYEFEFVVADDNTLWNSRVVVCFHNTSHPVAFSGSTDTNGANGGAASFAGLSDDASSGLQDCVKGGSGVDLRAAGGLDDANPAGATANDGGAESVTADTSRAESWRKARWVMKQKDDGGQPYGVDPTASQIINDTTNNGSWRLNGAPGVEATDNAACTHKVRDGAADRWDSTMIQFQCTVRIGTLARATVGETPDWDLFLAVVDAGTAASETVSGDAFMDLTASPSYGNAYAYCSAVGAGHVSPDYNGDSDYDSCGSEGGLYVGPTQYKVATNLSIGTVENTDFGALTPPTQNPDGSSLAPPAPDATASGCGTVGEGETPPTAEAKLTCSQGARQVDNLVANTDNWKFQMKSGPDDTDVETACNFGETKIAPALGYTESSDYACWYTTTNSVDPQGAASSQDPAKTFGVALWEPEVNASTEWSSQANMFALRCIAYPKDPNEAGTYTRSVPFPNNGEMNELSGNSDAEVYVGRTFKDIPLYEYQTSSAHTIAGGQLPWKPGVPTVIDSQADSPTKKQLTNRNAFDGMGSDNSSIDSTRIWQRLEYAADTEGATGNRIATPYEAYVHCRLDTGYVRPGTYTGVVYLGITDAS